MKAIKNILTNSQTYCHVCALEQTLHGNQRAANDFAKVGTFIGMAMELINDESEEGESEEGESPDQEEGLVNFLTELLEAL